MSQPVSKNTKNDSPEQSNTSGFVVEGKVEQPRRFAIEDLLTMDAAEENNLLHACGSGEPKGKIKSCRGILLTDILSKVAVEISDHNDTKRMYIVASSSDGYTALFSWQELFNTPVGEGVMVILERDGIKIYEEHGCVDFFSAKDFLTGPRYVKQLSSIKVLMPE